MPQNKDYRTSELKTNKLDNIIKKAKLSFNEQIEPKDRVLALDEDAQFLVLIKKSNNRVCWVVDFLLGERIRNYNDIPKIKLSDYLKVIRFL